MFRRKIIYTKRSHQLVGIAKCSLLFLYVSMFIVQGIFSHAIQYNSHTNRYEYYKKAAADHHAEISNALIEKHKSNAVVRVSKRFQPEAAPCIPVVSFHTAPVIENIRITYNYVNPIITTAYHHVVILRGPPAVA